MKTLEELFTLYVDNHKSNGKKSGPKSFLSVRTFSGFCMNRRKVKYISQQLVDEWCAKRQGETEMSNKSRVGGIRQFLNYTNNNGYTTLNIPASIQLNRPYKRVLAMEHPMIKSLLSDKMDEYLFYLKDGRMC